MSEAYILAQVRKPYGRFNVVRQCFDIIHVYEDRAEAMKRAAELDDEQIKVCADEWRKWCDNPREGRACRIDFATGQRTPFTEQDIEAKVAEGVKAERALGPAFAVMPVPFVRKR